MLVTIDKTRIYHLLLLLTTTLVGGYLLIYFLEWGRLSAYGLSCTVSCQISDAILKAKETQRKLRQEEEAIERRLLKKEEKQKEKAVVGPFKNPKKKRRNIRDLIPAAE